MKSNLFLRIVLFTLLCMFTEVLGDLEQVLADINKNGFSDTLLFEVVKANKKSSQKDLLKQLESPKIQKLLISNALKYASAKAGDEIKTMQLERSSWRSYCSYSWIRRLSFMKCNDNTSTSELDREENNNFQVIKDDGKCYR